MHSLPQELINIIIGLVCNDFGTLIACSTVDRAWTYPCRVHLVHDISFDFAQSLPSARRTAPEIAHDKLMSLHMCLTTSPGLTEYVASFTLRNLKWRNDKWDEALNILADILRSLHHIKRFSLQNGRWEACSDELKDALMENFRGRSLEHVDLREFTTVTYAPLLDLLSRPPNLKTLSLINVSSKPQGHEDDSGSPTIPDMCQLQTLHIDVPSISPVFSWLLSANNFKNLSRIHVSDRCPPVHAEQFLRLVGCSIEELELYIRYGPFGVHDPIHLHDLPHLRLLNLFADTSIPLIDRLFKGVNQPHPLEEIRIAKVMSSSKICSWTALDTYLTQPALGSLRRVEFQMVYSDLDGVTTGTILARFPIMCERDMIHIRMSD